MKISISNLIKYGKFKTPEEAYLKINNVKPPKCIYCDNVAKFGSFYKGYYKYCDFEKHKDILYLNGLQKRKKTIEKNKIDNYKDYDEFIFKNMNFYLNKNYPKKDIFDNKTINSLQFVKNKSPSKLNSFNVQMKCICCGNDMNYNVFNHNKVYCNKKSCTNTIRYNPYFSDIALLYNFNIREYSILKRNNKLNYNFKLINELFIKYGLDITKNIISGYVIIYNNIILKRKQLNHSFSFLNNNIHIDDMYRTCFICGEKYLYKDVLITTENKEIDKILSAKYSCSKKCYYKVLEFGLYDKNIEKQSSTMKNKILNGEFTPNITNSWANSKIKIKLDGKAFRSSWEAYFYIFMLDKQFIEYEKLRLLYYDTEVNKMRTYITDFIDEENKILYEIKPFCDTISINTINKEKAALKWCKENNYEYIFITEEWFDENYNKDILEDHLIGKEYKEKLIKNLKQFERK